MEETHTGFGRRAIKNIVEITANSEQQTCLIVIAVNYSKPRLNHVEVKHPEYQLLFLPVRCAGLLDGERYFSHQ